MQNIIKKVKIFEICSLAATLLLIAITFFTIFKLLPQPFNFATCIFLHVLFVILMSKVNTIYTQRTYKPYIDKIPTKEFEEKLLDRNYFALDRPERIEALTTISTEYNIPVQIMLYKLKEIKNKKY